ncbi:MAG: MFS transporter [Flavobacteriales bacterium]|nr:MFS transporter [Flavobacteriales bacterium]
MFVKIFSAQTLPLKMSFLIFSMVLNCMGILILQLSGNQISYNKLGLLEAFKDLPIAFVSLFAVNFIHRLGNKNSLLISLFIVGICCTLLPFVEEFWFYKIWFGLIGICFAMAKIAVYGLIRNNISTENQLAKVMSSVEASFMLGIFLVNIGFGWLLASEYSADWKFGFWFIALLAFLNFLMLLKTEFIDGGQTTEVFSKKIFAQFLSRKSVLFFSIIFGIVFIEQNFNSWLPSFYKKYLNVSTFSALQASAFLALFSYIGRVITSQIIHKFSLAKYFLACVVLIFTMLMISYLLLTVNDSQIILFIFPLIGLFLAPLYPVVSSKMISGIKKEDINIFTSLMVIFSSLGSSVGSISISFLFQNSLGSYYAIFISIAVLIVFIIGFFYFKTFVSK